MLASCTSLDCEYDVDTNYQPMVQSYTYDNETGVLFFEMTSSADYAEEDVEISFLDGYDLCEITSFVQYTELNTVTSEEEIVAYDIEC